MFYKKKKHVELTSSCRNYCLRVAVLQRLTASTLTSEVRDQKWQSNAIRCCWGSCSIGCCNRLDDIQSLTTFRNEKRGLLFLFSCLSLALSLFGGKKGALLPFINFVS